MSQFVNHVSRVVKVASCAVLALVAAVPAFAQTSAPRFATLEAYRGNASVVRLGNAVALQRGMAIESSDIVVTRSGSMVVRFYSDNSQLRIGPNSRVKIDENAGKRDVEVFAGRLWARVVNWRDRETRIRTGSTIAAVRGTEFSVDYDGESTLVQALEGAVEVSNDMGSVTVPGGKSAFVAPGQAPVMRVMVRPQDAVQWALYFQPVIYQAPDEATGVGTWQSMMGDSVEAYRMGDVKAAIELLEGVDADDVSDPTFFTYRASLLLAASNLEAAKTDIERTLEFDPGNTDVLALQTVIAVAENSNDEALAFGDKAVQSDGNSATAHLAQSYARQAVFNLDGARESVERAVAADPDNALAWARLSELHLAFGRHTEALEAATTALEKDPNLARTETVLGYAYLAQVRLVQAKEAFENAIELNQGDPLARLGLGLAKIREGHLDDGITDIETAASLDPGNSLIRSYLGKAYYEDKRVTLEGREFDLAKQFDPNDPTPWFYQAIAKQTTNRAVEALRDMEKAIDLNDNRGVYRSRLLLDSDLAARSASLGRIYNDLGFQHLGLVEGWNSVNIDPTNFSAHRLLADNYAAQPRHDIARVSELFQSQMLQPINTTAIQPRLAESNLFLISAQGPSSLAFNEYNILFNRNQANAQISGMAGEDGTWSGEAIVSAIYNKASFSLGYQQFETDGWRENSDQKDEIGNAFFQYEFSPKTSFQAEYRQRETETGDLEMRFWEDDYRPELRENTELETIRAGLRHSFSPKTTLLLSYINQDKDIDFYDGFDFLAGTLETELDVEESSDAYEGQVLYRAGGVPGGSGASFNLIAGGGYFDIDNDSSLYALIDLPPPPFGPGPIPDFQSFSSRTTHENAYAYANITIPADLTFTLGVSSDWFDEEGGIGEKDQVNPKLGITWRIGSGTTVRGAYFETLKRTLVTDQTLEPTQVAGFNQFYDDPSGTSATVYGAAIDQKIGDSIFLGAQYTVRDMEIPAFFFDFETFELLLIDADQDEDLGHFYFYATPWKMLSLSAEYFYEHISHDPILQLGFEEVTTDRVPLTVQFIHPSGFNASAKGTWVQQDGMFELRVPPFGFAPGETDFWTLDFSLSYRLPKRFGFLSVGVLNATDEEFNYLATESILPSNARNLLLRPGRMFYGKITLAFP